jgi:hypothetical protein
MRRFQHLSSRLYCRDDIEKTYKNSSPSEKEITSVPRRAARNQDGTVRKYFLGLYPTKSGAGGHSQTLKERKSQAEVLRTQCMK